MWLLRRHIVDRLHKAGDPHAAERAQATLPEVVHTERDQALLQQCGVDLGPMFNGLH